MSTSSQLHLPLLTKKIKNILIIPPNPGNHFSIWVTTQTSHVSAQSKITTSTRNAKRTHKDKLSTI